MEFKAIVFDLVAVNTTFTVISTQVSQEPVGPNVMLWGIPLITRLPVREVAAPKAYRMTRFFGLPSPAMLLKVILEPDGALLT